jgi:hypothetical protein
MVCFRPAAPAFGALVGILLLLAGCTTPNAPATSPATPSAVTAPASSPVPSVAAATPEIAPEPPPAPEPTPAPAPEPEPKSAPVIVAEPIPAVVAKPVPVVVAKPALITGSEESSTMFDNFTAFVTAIDGRPVTAGRAGWNSPLALPAGPHRVTVAFIRGQFTAQTDVQLQARPAAVYQLKFATDAQIFGKSSYCEFSIVETATGENVLVPTRVPLTKLETAK